jgi:hypothetical protein
MANQDAPNGFQYHSLHSSRPPVTETFIKLSSVGTAIFKNDVVHEVDGASGSENAAAIEPFGTGTPGTTIPLGVTVDFGAANLKTRHHVITEIKTYYHAQDDADTDGLALADMGKRTNVSVGAGSTTTKYSGHEIDETTVHASAARDLLLLRLLPIPNNAFGANSRVIVRFRALSQSPLS